MRGVAQVFLKLIDKFPELEKAAFILIAIISVKMMLSAFGFHIPNVLFFSLLIVVFVGAMLISSERKKKENQGQA
ncbi:hypothetical protein D3C74_480840 [compost metagenome]